MPPKQTKIGDFFRWLKSIPEKLPEYWTVLKNPGCWNTIGHYNPEWDVELRELVKHHKFHDRKTYTAKLGNYTLWTGNLPYSCFYKHDWRNFGHRDGRPSRYMMVYCTRKLKRETGK